MIALALDTSSPEGSLALLRDAECVESRLSPQDRPYSMSVMRDVEELLRSQQISLEQIDLFAVNAGPGSFTGLRVGLTTVKAWAEVWRKPVAAVSGLAAMAAQAAGTVEPGSLIAAVMDARRGQIFGGAFLKPPNGAMSPDRVVEDMLATADEFLESLGQSLRGGGRAGVTIACTSAELVRPAIERVGMRSCRVEVVPRVLAPMIGRIGYEQAIRGEVVDALHLDANYIQRPDAETKWRSD